MNQESQDEPEFESLSTLMSSTCEACGERNSLRATECSKCGAAIQQKEGDEKALSILHSEGLGNDAKAITSSHKLRRLQLALAAIRAGEITLELYHAVVEQVLKESQAIQDILEMQALQQIESKLSSQAIDVLGDTADHVDAFCQACERMMIYDGTNSIQVADEGLALAESTILDMQETEREAEQLKSSS